MIIDARSGLRGVLIDLDAGRRIPCPIRANLETGEYEAYATLPDQRTPVRPPVVVRGRARLKWIPAAPRARKTGKVEIPDDGRPERRGNRVVVVPGRLCESRGCTRLAEYSTADEQELEPMVGADGRRYERAEAVRVHLWCPWHYRWPVWTSRRGVESEVTTVTTRPQ